MRVQILEAGRAFGYDRGDVVDIDESKARHLVTVGAARVPPEAHADDRPVERRERATSDRARRRSRR